MTSIHFIVTAEQGKESWFKQPKIRKHYFLSLHYMLRAVLVCECATNKTRTSKVGAISKLKKRKTFFGGSCNILLNRINFLKILQNSVESLEKD